jgi:hypothetical protein
VALRPTLSRGLPLSSDGAAMAPSSRGRQEVCQGRIPRVGAGIRGVQAPVGGTREREGSTDPAKRDYTGQPIRDLGGTFGIRVHGELTVTNHVRTVFTSVGNEADRVESM